MPELDDLALSAIPARTATAPMIWAAAAVLPKASHPRAAPTTGGTSLTISGSGFTGATAVYFGGLSAYFFTVNSDGSITVTVPSTFFTGP